MKLVRRLLRWFGFLPDRIAVANLDGFAPGQAVVIYPGGQTKPVTMYIHQTFPAKEPPPEIADASEFDHVIPWLDRRVQAVVFDDVPIVARIKPDNTP